MWYQGILWHFNFCGKHRYSGHCRLFLFLFAALHRRYWVSYLSHHWGEQTVGRVAETPRHLRRLRVPGILADTVQQYECSQLILCLDQGIVGGLGGARPLVSDLFLQIAWGLTLPSLWVNDGNSCITEDLPQTHVLCFAVIQTTFHPEFWGQLFGHSGQGDEVRHCGAIVILENSEYNVTLSILYYFSIFEDNLANHVFLSWWPPNNWKWLVCWHGLCISTKASLAW